MKNYLRAATGAAAAGVVVGLLIMPYALAIFLGGSLLTSSIKVATNQCGKEPMKIERIFIGDWFCA